MRNAAFGARMYNMTDVFPSEHYEQAQLVMWFRKTYGPVRIFAIPNGGYRSKSAAAKLKVEGVSAGVPDLFVPAFRLWIEMKRVKGGRLSPDQKDWIQYLEANGYTALVCHGAEDAKLKIEQFLEIFGGEMKWTIT
jgi:hypothetical protein